MAQQEWALDVQTITTKELTTTGGTLWSAATRCRDFLCQSVAAVGLDKPGVRVLELGAGCGTLGLTLARNLPHAAEVCLTEQAYGGALDHLRLNVAANAQLPNMGSVTCCACDWTHFTDAALLQAAAAGDGQLLQQEEPAGTAGVSTAELRDLQKLLSTPWDIIIGSDLIYNPAGARALPRVLATLMPPKPQQQCCQEQEQEQQQKQEQQQQQPAVQPCQGLGAGSYHTCQQQPQHADTRQGGSLASNTGSSSSPGSRCQQHCAASSVGPVMYYAHTKHRYDAMDVLLFECLAAEGLTVEEVVEPGCELPSPSPPPFSSLFPDMRCGVFKIHRAA